MTSNPTSLTFASTKPASRWLHYAAWATLLATFPLIFMGGLVTTKGAGMSVPDWPNTYGYNMFLFPPSMWIGGIAYEHSHRLLGTVVGFLAIAQFVIALLTKTHRRLALAVLLAVIVQGILGGLRVTEVNIHLAVAHGIFAQLVLCLMALTVLISSRFWSNTPRPQRSETLLGRKILFAGGAAFALVLVQLIIGAMMRHYGAGLAIPDLPLAYGEVLPPTTTAGLAEANAFRVSLADPSLKPVTLAQVHLHFAHRLGAILVSLGLLHFCTKILFRARHYRALSIPAALLILGLAAQVTLGLATVYYRKPADVTTIHHTLGAVILMLTFITTVRGYRIFSTAPASLAPAHRPATSPRPAETDPASPALATR